MSELVILNVGTAPQEPLGADRGQKIRLLDRANGSEKVDLHINVLNVGSAPGPYHYHAQADNVYLVLEGTLELAVEGDRYVLHQDDVIYIPPGLRHSVSNTGDVPVKLLEIYAPAGRDFHEVPAPDRVEDSSRPP